ncbi:hypothetical protein BDZ97DRAFT_1922438 [Flammula alnicola]|nr:hypothetical protein BDZ97DRAFT_1922438 [Flammula alnicola]
MNASVPQLSIQTFLNPLELYSDSREHGYQGTSRHVRLPRVTPPGGGLIAKSEDGIRCAVTGKESLRILRMSEPSQTSNAEHKSATGRGGHRIDASRNFWEGSGLKIDSASTDVAWGHGSFSNKILTSARNGELIMWDLNKSGVTKYERRTKDHIRSINKMSVSHIVHHYCITGSADGHMRVWDLRDMSKSIMRIHHPTSVRSLVFSPSLLQPLQAVVGLDNGTIYRWDLKMGQRGQLDKLPVAHSASVTTLDWYCASGLTSQNAASIGVPGPADAGSTGLGWLVSGGLDRCVKVWDLTSPGASNHIPHKPTYTLHPSFPVRRLAWRPGYECELAIVSNTEYATHSIDISQASPSPTFGPTNNNSGLLTRVGSGLGLDALMRGGGSNSGDNTFAKDKPNAPMATTPEPKASPSVSLASPGDAVEIWDVRRGWIAKWSVTGSAVEGGITDIAFGDSHAIWAQHASGTFSQLDLRNATKPIDSIPRVATTWEATGSMAFVVDEHERWEPPYDDLRPELRLSTELRKPPIKALGDPPARITTQAIATYSHDFVDSDVEMFTTLARRYIFEGRDRKEICAYNAGIALSAGHESAAQVWLLLGACLTEYLPIYPPTPPLSPPQKPKKVPSPLIQPSSSPRPSMSGYSFPPSSSPAKTPDSTSFADAGSNKISPARRSTAESLSRTPSHTPSSSTSRRITPTSSTSSSPRHLPVGLPAVTPRRTSVFGRRESLDSGVLEIATGGLSKVRRPSLSVTPTHSSSPSDRNTPSLRHVGEGVLDDSDSESGSDEGEETANANSSDGESNFRPMISPGLTASRPFPIPSPLSRVAGRQSWTEDEDDDSAGRVKDPDDNDDDGYSPSPQSTDSDSPGGSHSPHRRSRPSNVNANSNARRRSSAHIKSRSRSSTVASLPAPTRPLIHHDSTNSIRTVTAAGGETPSKDRDFAYENREGNHNDVEADGNPHHHPHHTRAGHMRAKSQAISELVLNPTSKAPPHPVADSQLDALPDQSLLTERRIENIRMEDRRFRETTLNALRDALDEFAEEGEVQMCTMLALVAPSELKISQSRAARFLDSYIELLTRLRLYTCAAYLRKYCEMEEIRKATLRGTIIYTSCGKCRKPLLLPAGSFNGNAISKGGFSYCLACKAPCVMCSICRLPVRTLLFQCSICNHGGHQACYRQYYLQQPMVDLPTSFLPNDSRGRTSIRKPPASVEDDSSSTISSHSSVADTSVSQNDASSTTSIPSGMPDTSAAQSPVHASSRTLVGHPCAAGCGHYCWAANMDAEDL